MENWKWCQSHVRSIKVYPILVHSIIEKKKVENTGSQMGHTKKLKKKPSKFFILKMEKVGRCGLFCLLFIKLFKILENLEPIFPNSLSLSIAFCQI